MSQINRLHQFVVGAYEGDAIYNQTAILQRWLQDRGWESKIYAENIQLELKPHIQSYKAYKPSIPGEIILLHYSIGSDILEYLLQLDVRFVLIYHNLTPAHFMTGLNTPHGKLLEWGRDLLPQFADRTVLALADSEYNQQDLLQAGYQHTEVLPVPFDETAYRQSPDQKVLNRYQDEAVNLLFVGRLVPNKRLEDVIKVFYHYHQINPHSRLFLVGGSVSQIDPYYGWLKDFSNYLGLADQVHFPGYVSLPELLAYYKLADVYVSMSEHEGYGVPLVESMYFDVPVVAYKATAIPYTLGNSGIQVEHKDYPLIAGIIDQVMTCPDLRDGIVKQQRQRLGDMSMERIKAIFDQQIDDLFQET